MEKINFLEQERNKKIKETLRFAMEHAISLDELYTAEQEVIQDKELFFKKQKDFIKNIRDSISEFKTITEFREAGKILGWDKEKMKGYKNFLEYVISHENAHLNIAEREGQIIHGYWILMIKNKKGQLIAQPVAGYELLDNLSDEELLKIEKLITQAPQEYDNHLSDIDIRKINLLDSFLDKDNQ